MYTDLALHIDGQWLNGDGRAGEDVINPATEKPLARLPHASKGDLDHALEAAKKGFEIWRNTSAFRRFTPSRFEGKRNEGEPGAFQTTRALTHGCLTRHDRNGAMTCVPNNATSSAENPSRNEGSHVHRSRASH